MRTQPAITESLNNKQAIYRRLAWLAPLFFLIKGLAWLVVPLLGVLYGLD